MPLLTHNELRLTQRPIALSRLPEAFDGFRIVQISDLHFYEHSDLDYYNRVKEAINALQADLIVLTGDVVHYGGAHVAKAGGFLRQLKAKDNDPTAKLAILGNHDYYDDAYSGNIVPMLAEAGFDLLKNAHRVFERHGQRLWVAGVDDLWHGQPNIRKALDGVPSQEEATIALIHNPLLFDPIALCEDIRVDLVLAGHTHAGHVYIPFLGPIYRRVFRMKYRYGLFEKNNSRLHVSSGVGSAAFYLKKFGIGFPRFRYNTHPEIAVLELSKA
jgi:predicted MPP superfamily phosphohydrolase